MPHGNPVSPELFAFRHAEDLLKDLRAALRYFGSKAMTETVSIDLTSSSGSCAKQPMRWANLWSFASTDGSGGRP